MRLFESQEECQDITKYLQRVRGRSECSQWAVPVPEHGPLGRRWRDQGDTFQEPDVCLLSGAESLGQQQFLMGLPVSSPHPTLSLLLCRMGL